MKKKKKFSPEIFLKISELETVLPYLRCGVRSQMFSKCFA